MPYFGTKTRAAIKSGDIVLPKPRVAFVRECVAFYEPILPRLTEEEYTAVSVQLLKGYPMLRDKGTHYWVSIKCGTRNF